MIRPLDADGRNRLERLLAQARLRLQDDLAAQASGQFGIDADGTIADETDLHLDHSQLIDRREVVEIVAFLRSEGNSPTEAVTRLLREAVFTHLNRFVAIRIAETLEMLPPSLADAERSQGFLDARELAPLLAADHTNGYWAYLRLCGDELAGDVPTLFDPRNPLLALAPSPGALRDVAGLFADRECADLWTAPDCLGWAYQFFNTAADRHKARYRADGSPKAPETSWDLAVRNQFFTPAYVVDFLVQNSLGRRLLDADPASPLIEDLPLLVDPPTEPGTPTELADVTVLDPACGSGHFLLGAYNLLERAWLHAGVRPAEAAPRIIESLWGIDIDPRCAQVASAALLFRARRSCPRGTLPRPHIVCARALLATATGFDDLLDSLEPAQRHLLDALPDLLEQAPVLGTLLKVEQALESAVRASFAGSAEGALADAVEPELIARVRDGLLDRLRAVAASTTATAAERLLVAEADDAVRFVAALVQRYDAVLQNPPFGDPVPDTRPYLKNAYPGGSHNLLAAFVGRGFELCKPEVGYVGAITARSGMFLKTFEDWRKEILLGHRLVALTDLGHGVMEQALVEAAAYVIRAVPSDQRAEPTFVRLLKEADRPAGLVAAVSAHRKGHDDDRVFRVPLSDLKAVPGWPVAYWMGPALRRLFGDHPSLDASGTQIRVGLQTGDDFRFVRAFWEVDPARIGRAREETKAGKRWAPFAKGGEYSPYWADIHLVVDWQEDGDSIRAYDGSRPQNTWYYFRPGLTWPRRTNSGFGIRVLPAGTVFADKGPAVFPQHDPAPALGWLKSRVAQSCIDTMVAAGEEVTSGSAARSYEVGLVKNLPWIDGVGTDTEISRLVTEVAVLRRSQDLHHETSRSFHAPAVMSALMEGDRFLAAVESSLAKLSRAHLRILDLTHSIESRIHQLAGLDSEADDYIDSEVGSHPASYRSGSIDEDKLSRMLSDPIDGVIDEITERRGGARAVANLTYFADRRLEVIAHGLERPPSQIDAFRRSHGILPYGEPGASAATVLSYLVGVAFGRWDIRTAATTEPELGDLFDPVPVHPPGMLLHEDQPARSTPPGYGFDLPPGQILLDQPGHPWDIVQRVTDAASQLAEDADRLLADLMQHLAGRDLREHLRKHFFKDHLTRYTKSRRKAPIYWPLYTPSRRWGLWLYAPSLTRETLYAVEAAATARLQAAQTAIRRLSGSHAEGAAGLSARQTAEALDAEQQLAEELVRFRQEAERVAGLGWEPDLDDGIVLCAAPLAALFGAWPQAAKQRDNLKAGRYPWASVSQWAEVL